MNSCRARCWGTALVGITFFCQTPLHAAPKKSTAPDADRPSISLKKKVCDDNSYPVKRGETLWGIARKYGVSVGELMDLNHMANDKVHEGMVLRIPKPVPASQPDEGPDTPRAPVAIHIIEKGESLRSIARDSGISQDKLEHANPKVDPDHPKAGTRLVLPFELAAAPKKEPVKDRPATALAKYVVRDNDTYYSIARARGLTTGAIARANPDVVPERLRPGMLLVLPSASAPQEKAAPAEKRRVVLDAPPVKKRMNLDDDRDPPSRFDGTRSYTVSHGESAGDIADAFGTTVKHLMEINGRKSFASLKAGSEIVVPDR